MILLELRMSLDTSSVSASGHPAIRVSPDPRLIHPSGVTGHLEGAHHVIKHFVAIATMIVPSLIA